MNEEAISTDAAAVPPTPPADAGGDVSVEHAVTPPANAAEAEGEPPEASNALTQASDGDEAAEVVTEEDDDGRAAIEREPYDFDRCTVLIGLQLLPADGNPRGRQVVVGVRSHLDAPIITVVREADLGPLPSVIGALLERLRAELPERERLNREAEANERAEAEARKARLNASRASRTTAGQSTSRRKKGKRDLSAAPETSPSATPVAAPPAAPPLAADDQPVQQLLFG